MVELDDAHKNRDYCEVIVRNQLLYSLLLQIFCIYGSLSPIILLQTYTYLFDDISFLMINWVQYPILPLYAAMQSGTHLIIYS